MCVCPVRQRLPFNRPHRLASAIFWAGPIVGIILKVKRPLQGAAYGLGRYSILPQGTGVASHAEVRAATGNAKSRMSTYVPPSPSMLRAV